LLPRPAESGATAEGAVDPHGSVLGCILLCCYVRTRPGHPYMVDSSYTAPRSRLWDQVGVVWETRHWKSCTAHWMLATTGLRGRGGQACMFTRRAHCRGGHHSGADLVWCKSSWQTHVRHSMMQDRAHEGTPQQGPSRHYVHHCALHHYLGPVQRANRHTNLAS